MAAEAVAVPAELAAVARAELVVALAAELEREERAGAEPAQEPEVLAPVAAWASGPAWGRVPAHR